jgi:rubrerythrin
MADTVFLEALTKALEMEQKGYSFYSDAAKKSKNTITRKTFSYLAGCELWHIESIKIFCNSLREKGSFPSIETGSIAKTRQQDAELFAKDISSMREKIKPDDDDRKACEFAMQLEKDGYAYYQDMLKNAKDENLKKLLDFLLKEEKNHYQQFESLYTFITDTKNWYMYEEGSFPQG